MQNLLTQLTSLEMVLVGAVVVSWVAVALAMASLIKVKRQEILVHNAMDELKRSVSIGNNGLMGMGRKLLNIEKTMQRQQNRPVAAGGVGTAAAAAKSSGAQARQMKPSQVNPFAQFATEIDAQPAKDSHYQQASTMLAQGLTAAQVASATGMSHAEIQLLAMLNGQAASVN
ncbi:DUF2802 domain-containing protein [Simiduia sp. 21SJ11W-1]|uniref:DUF2802 domain-containing protein n=1 Tax=Simiduia sp. 21SJ11W-1 TaxID=2909669 RepID=UPI0020A10138|nr:DUF2802 domain-containing protein [Simiduia sp. 21SJ11W-1]UTA49513.1 DUF2802 domain-containing protein [Simiduia sp. 21SJ11W-1]